MKRRLLLYICTGILMLCISPSVFAQAIDPQYIFLRKDPMTCNPSDCQFLWNMDNPARITADVVHDITDKVGKGNSAQTRKIGIGVVFNYWVGDIGRNRLSLDALLKLSQDEHIPLFIVFDAVNFWDRRPDLWYWWEPGISAEESERRKENVEWTCGNSSCAIKKAWRNWGAEFEVKPAPNLASSAVITATTDSVRPLLLGVSEWYKNLKKEDRYLLGGISMGMEVDIGGNYYYYPDGVKNTKGLPSSVQIGFNGVKTLTGKTSGLTTADINKVVSHYQTALDKYAYDLGIPRNKIFNHNGGKGAAPFINYPTGVAFENLDGSLNKYAQPGWSFYGDITTNPQNYPDLVSALGKVQPVEWSSPEWLTWASDKNGWIASLRNSLNFRNNRFINIANWEGIRDKPYIIDAIKTVASENPSCWVTAPTVSESITNTSATLTWEKGAHNEANYFQYSASAEYNENGTLKNLLGQENVSQHTSHTITSLAAGTYYWLLTADGCGNQRRNTYGSFQIHPSNGFGDLTTITSTPIPIPSTQATPELEINSNADNKNSLIPFWQGDTIYNESMLFVSHNGGTPEASLFFPYKNILSVKNSALTVTYMQGTDWTISANRLILPAGSRIPFLRDTDLTPNASLPLSYFHDHQVAVTYTHTGTWNGPTPHYAQSTLPNTIGKLTKHEPLKILLYGDSISVGYNTSGLLHMAPNLPPWGELVAESLKAASGSTISFINPSQVSKTSAWGAQNAKSLVADQHPDLVIIAFGMNDGVNMPPTILPVSPSAFKNNIQTIMTSVKATNPQAEFILVSPILMNPAYAGSTQESYGPVLMQLRKTGVELVDMTSVHKTLLKTKKFADINGNNINHPNDYLSRWYAQEIVGLLIPDITTAPSLSLPGDIDKDGHVTMADFTLLKEGYGSTYTMYDYNNLVKNFNK